MKGKIELARKKYAESVDITPDIAIELYNVLKDKF